jgi:hypothetical protein
MYYDHLVHFVLIWYIFSGFGIMYQEKSGNPVLENEKKVSKMMPDFFYNMQSVHKSYSNLFCVHAILW